MGGLCLTWHVGKTCLHLSTCTSKHLSIGWSSLCVSPTGWCPAELQGCGGSGPTDLLHFPKTEGKRRLSHASFCSHRDSWSQYPVRERKDLSNRPSLFYLDKWRFSCSEIYKYQDAGTLCEQYCVQRLEACLYSKSEKCLSLKHFEAYDVIWSLSVGLVTICWHISWS